MTRQPIIYGAVVFAAVFFVGWVTGMGGSLIPNLIFSLVIGALAAGMFAMITRRRGSDE